MGLHKAQPIQWHSGTWHLALSLINGQAAGQLASPKNGRVLSCSGQVFCAGNNSAKVAMLILATFSSSGYYCPGDHVDKTLTLAFCHLGIPLHLIINQVPIHADF